MAWMAPEGRVRSARNREASMPSISQQLEIVATLGRTEDGEARGRAMDWSEKMWLDRGLFTQKTVLDFHMCKHLQCLLTNLYIRLTIKMSTSIQQ